MGVRVGDGARGIETRLRLRAERLARAGGDPKTAALMVEAAGVIAEARRLRDAIRAMHNGVISMGVIAALHGLEDKLGVGIERMKEG